MKLLLSLLVMSIVYGSTLAQGYRGLVPLKSTCEDAKRILGIASCEPSHQYYQIDGETIQIGFTDSLCQKAFGKFWNVPVGTITYISRQPSSYEPLAKVIANESRCEKEETDIVGRILYTCNEEGLWASSFNGRVENITYVPKLSDDNLQCPQRQRKPKNAKTGRRRKS
jgi:hypothetical protein